MYSRIYYLVSFSSPSLLELKYRAGKKSVKSLKVLEEYTSLFSPENRPRAQMGGVLQIRAAIIDD